MVSYGTERTSMRFFADLHIHSRYSIATSRDLAPETLWRWAQFKGVTVVATGDATHPAWLKELGRKLDFAGNGLFVLREEFRVNGIPVSCASDVFFLVSAEISCIYSKNGKTRKVHCIVLFNDMESALRLQRRLSKIGNISSDGRPILGLDAKRLLKIVIDECPDALFIPAHAWTPHFSVFGSASGFDSLEECFEELTPHIHAIETGLSSNPAMNWRLSALDRLTLISNSDAHSPQKIGREANIFDTDLSYGAIADAIRTKEGFEGTVEFFPEEGKYHYDGHRPCKVRMTPQEAVVSGFRCPACGRKITLGVLNRVEALADRQPGFTPACGKSFHSLVSLKEIIAGTVGMGVQTKTVDRIYFGLLEKLGSELTILMEVPAGEIAGAGKPEIARALANMRAGRVEIEPGYDGEYGKIKIFEG
jgi:uncharacterized protein (TIGR00375 family)